MEPLLATYGYLGIFIGTLLEGEATVILAGIAAQQGFLELRSIVVVALFGTILGDQIFYYLARWKGYAWACRSKCFRKNYPKASELLHRHATWLILCSRFLYGLRAVIPASCGVLRIPAWRYSLLNLISALLWTPLMGYLGYSFGHSIQTFLKEWQSLELVFIGTILLFLLMVWFFGWRSVRDGPIIFGFKHQPVLSETEDGDKYLSPLSKP